MGQIKYYESYDDDFVESKNQNYELKPNYKWIHNNVIYKIVSYIVCFFVLLFTLIYSKLFLSVTIKNKKVLKQSKGYYIYSNHSQQLGDVFNPFLINFPKRPYIVCSPSNLGVPILGKLLPFAGALPIPEGIHDKKNMFEAMKILSKKNAIVIYPEGHLWLYYTKIRPFPNTSFYFPVDHNTPVYTATTTYQKGKIFKKPKITIYVDGPFTIDKNLSRKENAQKLHDEIYKVMVNRSKMSNYEYIIYKKK